MAQVTIDIDGERGLLDGGVLITLWPDRGDGPESVTIEQVRVLALQLRLNEGWLRERWEESARGESLPQFTLDLETGEISS